MTTEAEALAAAEAAAAEAAKVAEAEVAKAKEVKFTQADLDRIAAEARGKGRESGVKELLETLGVSDLESAKVTIAAAKAEEEARKTDLQKAQEAAAVATTAAEAARAEARTFLVAAKLEGALRDAGCAPARIASALKLVDRDKVTVEGSVVSGVDDAVVALKAESPEWFGRPASAPDASVGGQAPDVPFRDLPAAERRKIVREQYGINLP